jgi:hypothetical protein
MLSLLPLLIDTRFYGHACEPTDLPQRSDGPIVHVIQMRARVVKLMQVGGDKIARMARSPQNNPRELKP